MTAQRQSVVDSAIARIDLANANSRIERLQGSLDLVIQRLFALGTSIGRRRVQRVGARANAWTQRSRHRRDHRRSAAAAAAPVVRWDLQLDHRKGPWSLAIGPMMWSHRRMETAPSKVTVFLSTTTNWFARVFDNCSRRTGPSRSSAKRQRAPTRSPEFGRPDRRSRCSTSSCPTEAGSRCAEMCAAFDPTSRV